MANLLVSPRSAGRKKILSVYHADRLYSLEIDIHSNDRVAQDGLILELINPADPAVVRLVERDRGEILRFTNRYADKEVTEWFAFD